MKITDIILFICLLFRFFFVPEKYIPFGYVLHGEIASLKAPRIVQWWVSILPIFALYHKLRQCFQILGAYLPVLHMKEKKQNNTKISCKAILLCSIPSQENTWNGSFVLPAMVADLQFKSVENLRTGITASLRSRPCIFHVNYFLSTAKLSLRRKWRQSFCFLCYVFPWFFARLPPFPELRVFLFVTLASSFAAVSIRCMFPALDTVTGFPALRKGFLFFFSRAK